MPTWPMNFYIVPIELEIWMLLNSIRENSMAYFSNIEPVGSKIRSHMNIKNFKIYLGKKLHFFVLSV